ncbi:hypothetical protein P280DRAFT_541282 [Massarina eburnea CBS 473.64]|uniref:DUF4238 domain-containing protein n=1 Tax=Massarina eburnea CBS 473.64 TaxID=1395130 RepID=A0A6A6S5Y2_9PLEO|nr:hypothetical protein P280DRAFT_541282 [Massarina eburnea CBS 473.64]
MASSNSGQTQYHHFIPQFILKNFSHKYNPSKSAHQKWKKKIRIRRGDPMLHVVDFQDEAPQLSESPVKRTFGFMDMYRDATNASDYNILEKELSKLENQAARLISNIKDAFESGAIGFSMLRQQRDILRKFLFVMKYRGPDFYRRFNTEKYTKDDADQLKKYMDEKGYQNPVDVWVKSIRTILDLTIDLEGRWKQELLSKIYPDDAYWFIMHMEAYYLAFCTPDDPSVEFILTENCYNAYEGPNSTVLNPTTGKHDVISWTSYHEFSPLTPRLMLVLRSLMLPNDEEDRDEEIKTWRSHPDSAGSILQDLPLKKPRNSYTQVLPQGVQLLPDEDGSRRSYHQFTFSFFRINADHIQQINSILLENAYITSAIVFSSKLALKMSLEYYLRLPKNCGFKVIHRQENSPQLVYLKKLESVVRSLGSDVTLVFCRQSFTQSRETTLLVLTELGGSRNNIFKDLDQVRRMRYLRIKIDVHTRGVPERIRQRIRDDLRDLFCQNVPTRRVWYYTKSLRAMSLGSPGRLHETSAEMIEGPEDVIVKASAIVRPECLGLLLYRTVMQDIEHRRNPGLNPSSDFALDSAGAERYAKIRHLTFFVAGSIRDCGIKPIQDFARVTSHMIQETKLYEIHRNRMWSLDENIEILTRFSVRGDISSILSTELPADVLDELKDVLFNILYPTYEERPKSVLDSEVD